MVAAWRQSGWSISIIQQVIHNPHERHGTKAQ
jgi:hypothetical protein